MAAAVLRLYTDFVCPFCFIAEQSTVPRLLSEFELQLDWCGFELHPGTPSGGRPLSQLFPGVDLNALHERTRRFAATFGVTNFQPPNRLQNSRRALALAEVAREHGTLEALRKAAFEEHWRKGADLEDSALLRRLAEVVAPDADAVLGEATRPETLQAVDARQAQAKQSGVTGIPTFEIGEYRVVGCQPYEVLADAARRAGVAQREAASP